MSANIETVKRFNKACEEKDADAIAEFLHPEYTFKEPKMSFDNPKDFLEFMKICPFTGKPENIDFIEDGDKVVQIFDCSMSEPLSFTYRMCDILHFKDGKIIAEEVFYDTAQIPKDAVDIAEAAIKSHNETAA